MRYWLCETGTDYHIKIPVAKLQTWFYVCHICNVAIATFKPLPWSLFVNNDNQKTVEYVLLFKLKNALRFRNFVIVLTDISIKTIKLCAINFIKDFDTIIPVFKFTHLIQKKLDLEIFKMWSTVFVSSKLTERLQNLYNLINQNCLISIIFVNIKDTRMVDYFLKSS